MQNTWRRGLALGNAPDARILRWGYQHVGILEPTQTLKLALPPTPTPNASQWNIGGVGSSGVGHVYFMYISCCLCTIFRIGYAKISRRKPSFQWNMGLIVFMSVLILSLKKYRLPPKRGLSPCLPPLSHPYFKLNLPIKIVGLVHLCNDRMFLFLSLRLRGRRGRRHGGR